MVKKDEITISVNIDTTVLSKQLEIIQRAINVLKELETIG